MSIRTDLAIEAREIYQSEGYDDDGVRVQTFKKGEIAITHVEITSKAGEEKMGKPMGKYITLESPKLRDNSVEIYEDACTALSEELRGLINIPEKATVLVAGLGNREITPDAIGPKVVSYLMVTRHLFDYMPDEIEEGLRPVCAIAPGVLGLTGIETGEIIKGVVDKVKPDLIIAVDALASRRLDRVASTIQICDTGISPGSGVNNKRKSITKESLGVPVIAIGIPMIVDAATVANDTIETVIDAIKEQYKEDKTILDKISKISHEDKYNLIKEVLSPAAANLMVTPKEVDSLIERLSKIIANGINLAVHDGYTVNDIDRFLS